MRLPSVDARMIRDGNRLPDRSAPLPRSALYLSGGERQTEGWSGIHETCVHSELTDNRLLPGVGSTAMDIHRL